MANEQAPKKGRLTLYEDLLSAETKAEMAAKDAQTQAQEAKKKKDGKASMMFKPTHLGKKNTNKAPAKPKATFAKPPVHKVSSSVSTTTENNEGLSSTPAQKRGFEDWAATGQEHEEEWSYYAAQKRDEGNKRKKKKKKAEQEQQSWSWGDIYDPHAPVSFLDYPRSEVQIDINEQWKERLYEARRRERVRKGRREDGGAGKRATTNMQFAPPGGLSFAPPADYSSDAASRAQSTGTSSPYPPRRDAPSETGDEAFNRRMAMSDTAVPPPPPANQLPLAASPPVPMQPSQTSGSPAPAAGETEAQAKAKAQIAALKAKMAAKTGGQGTGSPQPPMPSASPPAVNTPPPPPSDVPAAAQPGVISAAPTYNPEYARMKAEQEASNTAEQELPNEPPDPEAPRSNRPGQMGFAEKYMKKHGHQKGQGLGAQGDGILTPIMLQQNKRKKRPDAEGGGFAAPATGRIVGGKRAKTTGDTEDAGEAPPTMTEVVKIEGMLANLDVDQEIQDNNLLQEIGEEMGTYGTVERLFIWRQHAGGKDDVFVKYTSPLSAMNAIRACDGQEFADNVMVARFWDAGAFERGEYA